MFGNSISSELYFIYGLIALIVILIIVIIVMDKMDSKKKRKSLSDTMSLKPISDPASFQNSKVEVHSIPTRKKEIEKIDIAPIPEIQLENPVFEEEKNEEIYVEDELEKTQAQIRVEEITKALEKAQVEEKDKYEKFEEEQERNAIISYEELKEEFNKLYSENEKTQYLEDDDIPINIKELYEMTEKDNKKEKEYVEELDVNDNETNPDYSFKSSPYISPVYGIENNKNDNDINQGNDFLNNLKELKNNLE